MLVCKSRNYTTPSLRLCRSFSVSALPPLLKLRKYLCEYNGMLLAAKKDNAMIVFQYQCTHKEPYFIFGLEVASADKIQFRCVHAAARPWRESFQNIKKN